MPHDDTVGKKGYGPASEEGDEDVDIHLEHIDLLTPLAFPEDEMGQAQPKQGEEINTDEFEHIAEIYDQIRMLHQQFLFSDRSPQELKTQIDRNLASYFDAKLKQVMEELALSQN